MTKQEAVKLILNSTWFEQACKNIGKREWEELRQQFWVEFLNAKDREFNNEKGVQFYVVRCLYNMVSQKFEVSYKQITKPRGLQFTDNMEQFESEVDNFDHTADKCFEVKESIINRMPIYERVLFRLHEKGMSIREISRETGICRNEIRKTINQTKEIISHAAPYI